MWSDKETRYTHWMTLESKRCDLSSLKLIFAQRKPKVWWSQSTDITSAVVYSINAPKELVYRKSRLWFSLMQDPIDGVNVIYWTVEASRTLRKRNELLKLFVPKIKILVQLNICCGVNMFSCCSSRWELDNYWKGIWYLYQLKE